MNPNNETELVRLRDAVTWSRREMEPFRTDLMNAVRQYIGKHYGKYGSKAKVYVNYLEKGITIYTQQLVGGAPRAYVSARDVNLRAGAALLQEALNYTVEIVNLERTLRLCIKNALFMMGIVKIGMTESQPWDLGGHWEGAGQPFVENIQFGDWVQDMTAKSDTSMSYCGNRYRVPLEEAKNNPEFDKKAREQLQSTERKITNEQGDERLETLSGYGGSGQDVEIDDCTDLWDLWLPREQLLVTVADDDGISKPLRVIEWQGPRNGPYVTLGFGDVPSNLLPLAPVSNWIDLHSLANRLFRKLGDQSDRQKSVLPVNAGSDKDANAIKESRDGEIISVLGEVPKEVRFGGPDQVNLAYFMSMGQLFNTQAGNLDALGGLQTVADTLGQEQMITQNASQRLVSMKRSSDNFVASIFRNLAHYLYSDPFINLPLQRQVGRTGIAIQTPFNANTRQGQPSLYKIDIEPYSMTYRNPATQIQQLMQVWNTVILPGAQLIGPQNVAEAMKVLLKMISDRTGLTELDDLLPILTAPPPQQMTGPGGSPPQQMMGGPGGPPPQQGGPPQGPPKPVETTRNYVRHNMPSPQQQGPDQNAMMQMLMSSAQGT